MAIESTGFRPSEIFNPALLQPGIGDLSLGDEALGSGAEARVSVLDVGIFSWRAQQTRVRLNRHLQASLNLDEESTFCSLERLLERVYVSDRARLLEALHNFLHTGLEAQFEFRFLGRANALRWISVRARVKRRDDGICESVFGSCVDITERKRSDDLFRGTFEQAAVGILHLCPRGLVSLENRCAERILGYSAVELRGRSFSELVHPSDRTQVLQEMEALRLSLIDRGAIECRMQNEGERYVWIHVTFAPHRSFDGQISHFILTLEDIEERKSSELRYQETKRELETNLLRQKTIEEKLRQADRAKDEFLAILSHELRTPLNVILGYVELLKKYDEHTVNRGEALDAIERSALAQSQLVGDLLEVSRVIAGKLPFNRQIFDPSQIIANALEGIRFTAEAKNITLSSAIQLNEPLIEGDPGRLQQIFANLLSNAIKFTPPGGTVGITAVEQEGELEFRVFDTGIGIPIEIREQVFDRFWQEGVSLSPNQHGLGLGLAIVKHLTELHGGHVWVESSGRNQGSTFVVRIPSYPNAIGPDH